MEFTSDGLKALDKRLRAVEIAGIANPLKIIILFAFLEGQDVQGFKFSPKSFEQIDKIAKKFSSSCWQVRPVLKKLENFGCLRKIDGDRYELTKEGENIVKFLYSIT